MAQYRKSVLPGYRQALPKYQNAGETEDSLGEDILEIFDPTGISSYDDVYRTFKNPDAKWWEKGLAVAGALPIVGKFGKAAKLVGEGAKAAKKWSELSKLQKLGRVAQTAAKPVQSVIKSKPVQTAVKYVTPVAAFDRNISPVSRLVAGATEHALQKIPGRTGTIARGVADFGSFSNQNARFIKAGDAITGDRELKQRQMGGNAYDGIYNNYLNPTDMYFYAVGGVPNNPGFNALPDHVQRKIIANMMYGGSKRFQEGGEEDSGMIDEYEPYQEEMYYPEDDFDFSSENQMIPGAAFTPDVRPDYGMVGPQMPTGYTPQPAAAAPQYSGVSIVDYLSQNPSMGGYDYASRKQLAAKMGIKGYRGTAQQNLQMLAMLQGKPYAGATGARGAGAAPKATKEEREAYNEAQGQQNPYVAIDPATGNPYAFNAPVEGTGSDDSGSSYAPWALGAAGAAGLGGLGYGAYKMYRGRGANAAKGPLGLPSTAQKLLPSSEMAKASQFRSNVNAGKSILSDINKKGFYTVDDVKALKNAGYKNIEGMMSQFPKGARQAATTAAEAKKAASFAKNIRNAIPLGQKAAKFTKAGEGLRSALRAGWSAAKATPAFKLFRREDGGDTYSAGVFYNQGGGYPYGGSTYGQMPQAGYLPQYMYGMGMQDGGSAQEMYVTPEEMEMLRQQGYDFDVIG